MSKEPTDEITERPDANFQLFHSSHLQLGGSRKDLAVSLRVGVSLYWYSSEHNIRVFWSMIRISRSDVNKDNALVKYFPFPSM